MNRPKFERQGNYLITVWEPDMSRGLGDQSLCVDCANPYYHAESDAGQPHLYCSARCEKHAWKINAYVGG